MSLINPSIRQTKRRYVRRWRGKTFVLYQKLGVMSSKDGPAPPIQVTSRKQMLQLYGAPQPISTMTADDILKSIASDEDKPLRVTRVYSTNPNQDPNRH